MPRFTPEFVFTHAMDHRLDNAVVRKKDVRLIDQQIAEDVDRPGSIRGVRDEALEARDRVRDRGTQVQVGNEQ